MKSLPYAVTTAAIALIVQGCADLQWTRPGADAAAVSSDLDECRAQALRSSPPLSPSTGPEARTDGGRPAIMAPSVGSNERFVAEHEALRRCMIRRGYELKN